MKKIVYLLMLGIILSSQLIIISAQKQSTASARVGITIMESPKEQGFFSTITGAVIGNPGKSVGLAVAIILVIIILYLIIKKSKNKRCN